MRSIGKTIGAVALAAWMLAVIAACGPVFAASVEDIYSQAVQQLNRRGFAGIDEALETFETLIKKDPAFVRGYISAADAYLLKYQFAEKKNTQWLAQAQKYLDTAAEMDKQNPAVYFKRALIHFSMERTEKGMWDLQKAMALAPDYLDARLLYLQYLLFQDKKKEAREFVDVSIRRFPDNPAPLRYLADTLLAGGDNEKALELYRKVVRFVPKAPNTYLAMGKAHLNLKQYEESAAAFRKALEQSPELAEAHFNLATVYSETGKLKEAVGQLETYVGKVPGDTAALNNLALLYEQTGQITRARLTWLKLKNAAKDETYRSRAEQHLQALSSRVRDQGKGAPAPGEAAAAKGGKP